MGQSYLSHIHLFVEFYMFYDDASHNESSGNELAANDLTKLRVVLTTCMFLVP